MTSAFQDSPPGDPPPPDKKKNVFERIAGVLFAPAETFQDIARRPDIVGPLLVIVIIGYISTALVMPKMDLSGIASEQAEQMRKQGRTMSEEDMARVQRFAGAFAKVAGWTGPILAIVVYALIAGILLLAFRLAGGDGTYKQAFSVTLYAWMPLVLFGIISTIVIVARGTFDPTMAATLVKSNPAFLVDMKEQRVLFTLLAAIDVFTLWTLALLTIGFAAVARFTRSKAAVIVFSLWIALVLIKVGFAAFTASRMQG